MKENLLKDDYAETISSQKELELLREEIETKEIDLEYIRNKYYASEYRCSSLFEQVENNESLIDYQTPRYIIGTALFDIIRHPMHFSEPAKRIVECCKWKFEEKIHNKTKNTRSLIL